MVTLLAAAIINGVPHRLEAWSAMQRWKCPESPPQWVISDDLGALYAWTAEEPARHEWRRMVRAGRDPRLARAS